MRRDLRTTTRQNMWLGLVLSGLLAIATAGAPQGGNWAKKGDMPTPRYNFCTAVVDGKVYVIGGAWGHAKDRYLTTVEEYDPETDTWTRKANMPTGREALSASVVDGKIYAIGGWNGEVLATVEEYDPEADTWIWRVPMAERRYGLSTSALNGKIYAIGGAVNLWNGLASTAVEEYDPASDRWAMKARMAQPRYWLTTSVANETIWAVGGMSAENQAVTVMEAYEPAKDKWTKRDHMPEPKATSVSTVDGRIYIIGGWSHWHDQEEAKGFLSEVAVYDPITGVWAEAMDMPTPRRPSTAVVNGKIYAIGGTRFWPLDPLPSVEEYTPDAKAPRVVSPQGRLTSVWGEMKRRSR